MTLRGYQERSPLADDARRVRWPDVFVTVPSQQFQLLRTKYVRREPGRIPLPRSSQELWAQHKYSVMARDPETYRALGRRIARLRGNAGFTEFATELVEILRRGSDRGRVITAIEHLWGHVNTLATADQRKTAQTSPECMLQAAQRLAMLSNDPYLMASTALADLTVLVTSLGGRATRQLPTTNSQLPNRAD